MRRPWVATLVRTIFDQPDAAECTPQFGRVVAALEVKLPAAADHLSAAREDLLALTTAPRDIRQVWASNPRAPDIEQGAGVVVAG
jgi:putative transposase